MKTTGKDRSTKRKHPVRVAEDGAEDWEGHLDSRFERLEELTGEEFGTHTLGTRLFGGPLGKVYKCLTTPLYN